MVQCYEDTNVLQMVAMAAEDWQGNCANLQELIPVSNNLQGHSTCESSGGLFYVRAFVMQPKK